MLKSLPSANELPEDLMFGYTTLMQIKDMAAGMTKEEILATFSVLQADLDEDLDSKIYFDEFYAYGKGMAVHNVVQNLIEASKGKTGTVAAMQFLRRFSKEFEQEVDNDASGAFSFSFGDSK